MKRGMMVPRLAHLDEADARLEMVNDLLHPHRRPPLRGEIVLSSADDDPERGVVTRDLRDLADPAAFVRGEMDVTFEGGRMDMRQAEPFGEEGTEAVQEMPRLLVAAVDQGVLALDRLRLRVVVGDHGEMGIVLPQVRARRAHVGEEPAGIVGMQITNRRRQHDDVAGGLGVYDDELSGHWRRGRIQCSGGVVLGSIRRIFELRPKPRAKQRFEGMF